MSLPKVFCAINSAFTAVLSKINASLTIGKYISNKFVIPFLYLRLITSVSYYDRLPELLF